MSTKKRPGVEAALRLIKRCDDVQLWETIEFQIENVYKNDTTTKPTASSTMSSLLQSYELVSLKELQQRIPSTSASINGSQTPSKALSDKSNYYITKDDLLNTIIPWKFLVGKPRQALKKYLLSNTNETVKQQSQLAISLANEITIGTCNTNDNGNDNDFDDAAAGDDVQIKEAIQPLLELSGVGPATASAILTLVRPDIFCYMYDEIIDTFLPKRTYTLPVYLQVRHKCHLIATKLNMTLVCSDRSDGTSSSSSSSSTWTPARVAKILWIACKICAACNNNKTKNGQKGNNNRIIDYTLNTKSITTTKNTKGGNVVDDDDDDDDEGSGDSSSDNNKTKKSYNYRKRKNLKRVISSSSSNKTTIVTQPPKRKAGAASKALTLEVVIPEKKRNSCRQL